jgi:DNA replication and repair protein RecF
MPPFSQEIKILFLRRLHLHNFRNYRDRTVEFLAPKTIILGDNAQGKSNLLEAIELLATLKSHRANRDIDLITSGCSEAKIGAQVDRLYGEVDLALVLRDRGRRTASINGAASKRQSDFLGHLNAVEFSCLDLDLVRGAPEQRRDWLDGLLNQVEPIYSHIWQTYHQVLRQRNALLKQSLDQHLDLEELELWNQQLIASGVKVIRRRARILERLLPIASLWHSRISGRQEHLTIDYLANVIAPENTPSAIAEMFRERLAQRQIAECSLGTTLIGPHRDDLALTIDGTLAKRYGSQGQQRTLVLALKLAELELIEQIVGEPPLLLLDDVLAELDLQRQEQLLATIADRFQTVVTTTHLGLFDRRWLEAAQILVVHQGQIQPWSSPA